MIKIFGILILIIFLFSNISASCNETQIDINTANLTELDKIKWVGPSTAGNIINYRQNNQFNSVDELLNVSGIGPTKLSDIKDEGLACVSENAEETQEQLPEENETTNETTEQAEGNSTTIEATSSSPKTASNSKTSTPKSTTKAVILDTIDLNSKDIKSENNNENLGKNLALVGIATFCVGFGALFFLRFAKRKTENEFR